MQGFRKIFGKICKNFVLIFAMTVVFANIVSPIYAADEAGAPAAGGDAPAAAVPAAGGDGADRRALDDELNSGGSPSKTSSPSSSVSDQYESGTLLPETDKSIADCNKIMQIVNSEKAKEIRQAFKDRAQTVSGDLNFTTMDVLACGIKTGDIKLWMVPYYIRYVLEFVLGLAGLVSIAGLIFGGFVYIFAGLSDDKEKGKKAILYSIIGFILSALAWAIVNIVIALVT